MSGRPRIMLVSGREEIKQLVGNVRLISHYDLFCVEKVSEAYNTALSSSPDLIILDLGESSPENTTLFNRFKTDAQTSSTPIISMYDSETELDLQSLESGAADYLLYPIRDWELVMRIKVHLRLREYQEDLIRKNRELEEYSDLLLELNSRLEGVARKDELTRIWNRRAFNEQVENIHNYSLRYQHSYCIIMADLDRFKDYNDQYGHQEGDRILEQVASALNRGCRSTDFVARFGGEEFVILLPETDTPACKIISQRVLNAVRSLNIKHETNAGIGIVTVSLGISEFAPHNKSGENWEHVLRRADEALYMAKRAGRNRVCYN